MGGYDLGRMEIKKYVEDGTDFQLEHPVDGPVFDDEGKPITINMSGSDCSRIKAAVREREQRKKQEAEGKPERDETNEDLAEIQREENIHDLATLTNGWSDNWQLDGKPFPFSKENAVMFFRRFPDVADWATRKVTVRLNFMLGSSKKSSTMPRQR